MMVCRKQISANRAEADSYYSFDDKKRAFAVKRYDAPHPWLNYLSNGRLHSFVSQAGGGFVWWKSPMVCRLTRYRSFHLPSDSPGLYIYIKDKDGSIWSPTYRPCDTKPDSWKCEHFGGKSVFTAKHGGVQVTLTYFVNPDSDIFIRDLNFESVDGKKHDIDVYAYAEYSQPRLEGELYWGYYIKLQLETFFDKKTQSLNYLHHDDNFPHDWPQPLIFLASGEKPAAFCGSRDAFMGNYRDERDPEALHKPLLGNEEISCGEPAGVLQHRITVPAKGKKNLSYYLGVAENAIHDFDACIARRNKMLADIRKPGACQAAQDKLDRFWAKQFDVIQCTLPDPVAMRQINTWNVVNSRVTGQFSRSVNADAPGIRAIGFRDSCQDMISTAQRNPDEAKEMLRFLLSHQFDDGHCVHMAHRDEWGDPWLSVHSDDHLWLPLTAYAIAAETGEKSFFLDEKIPFFQSKKNGTVWTHLMKTVEFAQAHIGQHGILLTLKSDWNDIIGRFNKKGKGESVFVSQQYVYALSLLIEMADYFGKKNDSAKLRKYHEAMQKALNKCAWDGAWFRRGFDDEGVPVGSKSCDHGKIFLNPQSWAVLGETGTEKQRRSGLDSAYRMLETKIGLQLMAPGFQGWNQLPGETALGYLPGCGENGAIFCHANTWAVIAEALAGNPDRAWQYFTQLIPDNVIGQVGLQTYRAEPYAWVSNIVGPDNPQFGWGNVNQITGTAPWMDVAASQYLLGLRPVMNGLLIDPKLPSGWTGVNLHRVFEGCSVDISVKKPKGIALKPESVKVNGKNFALVNEKLLLNRDFLRKHKSVKVELKLA